MTGPGRNQHPGAPLVLLQCRRVRVTSHAGCCSFSTSQFTAGHSHAGTEWCVTAARELCVLGERREWATTCCGGWRGGWRGEQLVCLETRADKTDVHERCSDGLFLQMPTRLKREGFHLHFSIESKRPGGTCRWQRRRMSPASDAQVRLFPGTWKQSLSAFALLLFR